VRFVGLVLALIALALGYYLGFRGLTFSQTRDRLAQLLNLPGIGTQGGTADVLGNAAPALAAKAVPS